MEFTLPGGGRAAVTQTTRYPVEGRIQLRLELNGPQTFGLHLRIPGWTLQARVALNGGPDRKSVV